MESTHTVQPDIDSSSFLQFCAQRMINWKTSYQAMGYRLAEKESKFKLTPGCMCISAGSSGSNFAGSINKLLDPIYHFFQVATTIKKTKENEELIYGVSHMFWKIQANQFKLQREERSHQSVLLAHAGRGGSKINTEERTETTTSTSTSTSSLLLPWNPNSKECELCKTEFTFWKRRHHCRICGSVVCWTCSQNRLFVPGYKGAARVCKNCFELEMGQTGM